MANYELSRVAVDPVIFTITDEQLKVLLAKREKEPFKDRFELIGGLLQHDETAEETVKRKLKELLGKGEIFVSQFHTCTNPKRDPRARTISIGFLALVSEEQLPKGTQWFSVARLPLLAFDHKEIIAKAHDYLKQNLSSEIVRHFLPETFPLNKLQEVHEIITGVKLDNRNFRKQMLSAGVVVETKERECNVSHRPAVLYRFA
jgi:8-oxo-dGTP diphosphatase